MGGKSLHPCMAMDAKTRLIEAATQNFSDDVKMQVAARKMLDEIVESDAEGVELVTQRWAVADGKKGKRIWFVGLCILVAGFSIFVVRKDYREVIRTLAWMQWTGVFSSSPSIEPPQPEAAREYTPAEELLLFGDPSKSRKSEEKEALWQSEPENVAFYAEYLDAHARDYNRMPPDFLVTAKRMDPGNAWFTYQAAAIEGTDAVKSKNGPMGKKVNGKWPYRAKTWEILDQSRWDRSLALIREARIQSKFDDYSAEQLMKRSSLLPKRSFTERLDAISVFSEQMMSSSVRLRVVAEAIAAKAWTFGEAGDREGLQEIINDGGHFLRAMADSSEGNLLYELVATSIASTLSESFAGATEKLSLLDKTAEWKDISIRLRDRKDERATRKFMVDDREVDSEMFTGLQGSFIVMFARQVASPPPLTAADLKPGRLLDHEFASRLCSYGLWICMLIMVGIVVAHRFRVSKLVRCLAKRMEGLLLTKDWLWVIGVGVLLPFTFVMMVNRLTPLGGRQFAVSWLVMLLPTVHFIGLLMLWLVVPVMVIRWRLGKIAAVFGFAKRTRVDWLVVFCAVALIPLSGWVVVSGAAKEFFTLTLNKILTKEMLEKFMPTLAVVLLFVVIIGWLWHQVSSAVLSRPNLFLHRVTISLVLVRVYLSIMLLLVGSTLAFKAAELHWFEREMLGRIDSNVPGWSRYEYEVAVQARRELKEVLGYP